MDKKKITIVLLIIVIIGCISFSIYMISSNKTTNNEDIPISNIDNKNILKNFKFDDMDISGQLLNTNDGSSKYMAHIVNNSGSDKRINNLYVVFELEDSVVNVLGMFDEELKNGSDKYIDLTIDRDLSNVKKISYSYEKNEEVVE